MEKIVLSENQSTALDLIEEFLDSDKRYFTLTGFAGTGKTHLVSDMIKKFSHLSFLLTAPTNKAVSVLKEKTQGLFVDTCTIHSYLKIKPQIVKDKSGNYVEKYLPDKFNTKEFPFYSIVVIDEASMINKELYDLIFENVPYYTQIIFIGDLAQLPPVNEVQSLSLSEVDYNMTQVLRQAEMNPVSKILTEIRDNIDTYTPLKRENKYDTENNLGILFYDQSYKFYEDYIKDFVKGIDIKMLAWTNDRVNDANNIIRQIIYGENCPQLLVGERMIAKSPVLEIKEPHGILINNSDEFIVNSFKDYTLEGFQCYQAEVSSVNNRTETIYILKNDQKHLYKKKLDEIAKEANRLKDMQEFSRSRNKWFEYFRFKDLFADVDYAYALTVHKSQGSTFEKVYVIEQDILLNRKIEEMNRCRYVAFSRPSNVLCVL